MYADMNNLEGKIHCYIIMHNGNLELPGLDNIQTINELLCAK